MSFSRVPSSLGFVPGSISDKRLFTSINLAVSRTFSASKPIIAFSIGLSADNFSILRRANSDSSLVRSVSSLATILCPATVVSNSNVAHVNFASSSVLDFSRFVTY